MKSAHGWSFSPGCRCVYSGLYLMFFLLSICAAQEKVIKNVLVAVQNNQLKIHCHFDKNELINDERKQTLASGMSSTLSFQINLRYKDGSIIRSRSEEVAVRYDVWEKEYFLFYSARNYKFTSYEKLNSYLCDSLKFDMGSTFGLDDKKPMQIILLYSQEKITSTQKEKLNAWLVSNTQTRESAPGLEQESGFSIDLSNLFSIFLSDRSKANIEQFQSHSFVLDNLR